MNPESGTISYLYDANGNPTKKTDSRGVSTHFIYDALNRITQRSYTGEIGFTTPTVFYTYDEYQNAIGRLTKVSNGISETRYTAFDIVGRVQSSQQITDGQTYGFGYAYNLAGMLTEETYPSGRMVTNVYQNAGELSAVQGRKDASFAFSDYAGNFTYASTGAVSGMRLGNGHWQSNTYNSRLQMTSTALGTTQGATNLLNLVFDYGATQNTGNLQSQTIIVPTVGAAAGFTAVQTYAYDSLNRLKSATETIGGNQTWKQAFLFDRYGNRNFDEANTTTLPKNCVEGGNAAVCVADRKLFNPSVNTANNRLNTGDGYGFDNAGNTTADSQGRIFKYDAENKQYEVRNSLNQTIGQYFFDGGGKRVKKVVPSTGETTTFVYDSQGRLAAEYSTQASQGPKTTYITGDHLGSPRIKTDQNGAVISRSDYHPYGEDIYTAQRTQSLGYKADNIRQKFTGYERDDETGLDFAQARMYANRLGRFTSVDPGGFTMMINPQSWNKYLYAWNSPDKFVDRDGRWPTEIHNLIFLLSFPGLSSAQMKELQRGSWDVDYPKTVLGYYANEHGMCKPSQSTFECALGVILASDKNAQEALRRIGNNDLESHYYFGRASHTWQDIDSPAHMFQVYDDSNFLACALSGGYNIIACSLYSHETLVHSQKENVIDQAQLNEQISYQRKRYQNIYGADALKNAVGFFADARFIWEEAIDGKKLPTVQKDDLGTVTVHSDGREEYSGPLEKIK